MKLLGVLAVLVAALLVPQPAHAASKQECSGAFLVVGGSDAVCAKVNWVEQDDGDLTTNSLQIFAVFGYGLEDCPSLTVDFWVYAGRGDDKRLLASDTNRAICKDSDDSVDTHVGIYETTGRKYGTVVVNWHAHVDNLRDKSGRIEYVFGG